MISDLLELVKRWRTSVHMTLWHNALVPGADWPCDICAPKQ